MWFPFVPLGISSQNVPFHHLFYWMHILEYYILYVTVGVLSFLGFLGGMLVFVFFAECKIILGDFFCVVNSTISIIVILELFWEGIWLVVCFMVKGFCISVLFDGHNFVDSTVSGGVTNLNYSNKFTQKKHLNKLYYHCKQESQSNKFWIYLWYCFVNCFVLIIMLLLCNKTFPQRCPRH